jgi:hypothetical protein
MRLCVPILFLTLVLSVPAAYSAPVIDHRPPKIEISPKDPTEEIASTRREFNDWSLRLGFLGGALKETNQAEQLYFYGLRYSFERETLQVWEFELNTGGDNFLHLSLGKKFYFPLEDVTLPYYKLGVGALINSSDNLASVFNIKKIQGMAAVGLDDLFSWDRRLQGEIGVAYALIGPQFEMSLGIAF